MTDKSIFRVHREDGKFFIMAKDIVNDERISWKAKGMLAYLLSKPDDWQVYVTDITNHGKDGIDAVSTGIKELEGAGYIVRNQLRESGGQFMGYEYHVYETPVSGLSINGKPVNGESKTTKNKVTKNNLNGVGTPLPELRNFFSEKASVALPVFGVSVKEDKAIGSAWNSTLKMMYVLCGKDLELTKELISATLRHAKQKRMTMYNPRSMQNIHSKIFVTLRPKVDKEAIREEWEAGE